RNVTGVQTCALPISSVERDAAAREVRVTAQHIFYDLLGNIVGGEYAPENVAASAVVEQLFARALNAHAFDVHCSAQKSVSGDYRSEERRVGRAATAR